MLLVALVSILASAPAHAEGKRIGVPGLGLVVTLPEPADGEVSPWGHTVGDASTKIRLGLRNTALYTDVAIGGTSWQPDLDAVQDLPAQVLPPSDDDLGVTPTGTEVVEVEGVGRVHVLSADVRDHWMERDLWTRVAVFPIAGAAVTVSSTSSESAERASEVLNLVLNDLIEVTEPALPNADLPRGELELESGYRVSLPPGWRALTRDETRKLDSARVGGESEYSGALSRLIVVDEAVLADEVFQCRVDATGTLEILPPDRSQRAVDNFKTFARVQLKGGRYRLLNGIDEQFIDVYADLPVVPDAEDELRHVSLGDREAYLWRVSGQAFEVPVTASLFYTAYGPLGLTCLAVAEAGEESRLNTFDAAMQTVRVLKGEAYAMPLSVRARYIRWWPSSHPLLQLYWLPIPLLLIAGWMVLKD